jgi:hypothetical protein
MKHNVTALFLIAFVTAVPVFAQTEDAGTKTSFAPLAAYNYIHLEEQAVHTPLFGLALMAGDHGKPYTGIHKSFFAAALYQPTFFTNGNKDSTYHRLDVQLDGRIERHNFTGLFNFKSDKPVTGGLHTINAGAAYGYEIIRRDIVSFVLGAVIAVGDFGVDMSNGDPLPVFPLPFVRLGFDTRWFDMQFEYMMSLGMKFTIAPESKVRFTSEMKMDYYRSIEDIIGEWTLWYRFFTKDSRLGDIAGIGAGLKNDALDFNLADGRDNTFEMQTSSFFACLDFTVLRIDAGYIFDSRYLHNGEKTTSPGKGLYVSLQGQYKF